MLIKKFLKIVLKIGVCLKNYNKNFLRKRLVCAILVLFIGTSIIPLTEAINQENDFHNSDVKGLYYLRDDDPLGWLDVGSLLMGKSIEDEITSCGMFINFHFAQIGDFNQEYIIYNIYYHIWQKYCADVEYEVGYSTSSEHSAGFNEFVTIDINDYKSEVDGIRLIQILQYTNPEIAVFNGEEIFNFTIKMFGPNPHVLCSPNQSSFIILNLEDNETLKRLDRDDDLINDYDELFVYYTNPFDCDTDNDGHSDYKEINEGDDPNNYEDNFVANKPPNKPIITGPQVAKPGIKYDYIFTTTDPEEDDVYYYIQWGDEQNGKWVGQYSSGQEINVSHIWEKSGSYTITAKARDTDGFESELGSLNVKVPKSSIIYNDFEVNILEKFPLSKRPFFQIK